MSLYGALAENTRRNERVDRGLLIVPTSGVGTIGFTSSQTINLTPAYGETGGMRFIVSFTLTIDDNNAVLSGIVGASTAVVTGSLNALQTILTVRALSFTGAGNPTLIAATTATRVRFEVWGAMANSAADEEF